MTQIALNSVGIDYGAGPLLDDVNVVITRGERWGLVGRNGTGKTTLLNLITGRLAPTRGMVTAAGGLRITLLDQQRSFEPTTTVWQAAAQPFAPLIALERELEEQAIELAAAGEAVQPAALARYDADLEQFRRSGGYTFAARVDEVLSGLGFDPAAAHTQPVSVLSGGELGRVALARQLADPADVLLLDEPTNHLDLDTTRWLEQYLRSIDATTLLISHDREFLDAVIDHVLHLEGGTAVPYAAGYRAFVEQRAERRLAQQRAYSVQQRVIAAEEDYIRRNIAGQNSRQAKGRRKRLQRLPRLSAPVAEAGAMSLRLVPAARSGDQVLVLQDVKLAIGTRTLVDGFSAHVRRGEVIGIVGPNGSGKSTLLRAIIGQQPLAAGTIQVGPASDIAYYRQDLEQVPEAKTLFDIIHDLRPLWNRGQVQAHLGRFGFSGDTVQRLAGTLSGGERARVALAMLTLSRANVLLLDEPTNHLDVESIEVLEDALSDYEGTVLLVSHDRALLHALVERIWAIDDARVTDYPGTFEEWLEQRASARERATREAAAIAEEQRERTRREARRRHDHEKQERASRRALERTVQERAAEVEQIETRVEQLRRELADPQLYANAAGVTRAAGLKRELDALEHALNDALHAWHEAAEELQNSAPM